MDAYNNLLEFWKKTIKSSGPYVHESDKKIIGYQFFFKTKEEYPFGEQVLSEIVKKENKYYFHTNLLPVPYSGDIKNAKIIYLSGNPGYEHSDYFNEFNDPNFQKLLVQNIEQRFDKVESPFIFIDSQIAHTGGYRYWSSRINPLLKELKKIKSLKINKDASRKYLSKNFGVLELTGYHSLSMNHSVIEKLYATSLIRKFLNIKIQEANDGKCIVLVARAKKLWGLTEEQLKSKNVIDITKSSSRNGFLSKGVATSIVKRLKLMNEFKS
jgi:hypothetical protein